MADRCSSDRPILFFDGVCGLCSHAVRFVFNEDLKRVWAFAPLQGVKAQSFLEARDREALSTVIVRTREGKLLRRGAAVREVLRTLPRFRWLWWITRILPAGLLNLIYRGVAASRYSLWGKVEYCERIPREDRDRFYE